MSPRASEMVHVSQGEPGAGHVGVIFGLYLRYFGVISGLYWDYMGVILGPSLSILISKP